MNFKANHWAVLDLQYQHYDEAFKLIAYTDVPCHLYCRMTSTPPIKRIFPASRRGIYLEGDVRFCFVVYEDNEQQEPGDTLIHTFFKDSWPACETRWFYFVGTQNGIASISETAIFKFHWPDIPPVPTYEFFYLYPNGVGFETSIRYESPPPPTTHWERCRHADTIWDPDFGPWGKYTGNFVQEKYSWPYYWGRDLYALQDVPYTLQGVDKLIHWLHVGKTYYPYSDYRHSIRTHDITYDSPIYTSPTGLELRSYEWSFNPFTSAPWTRDELKSLQAGVSLRHRGSFSYGICDQVFVEVRF